MISRPDAFSSVASAVIAMVGDGLTRARRSARKGMEAYTSNGSKLPTLRAGPLLVKPSFLYPRLPLQAAAGLSRSKLPDSPSPRKRGEGRGEGPIRDWAAVTFGWPTRPSPGSHAARA